MAHLIRACPMLPVRDLQGAADWYRDKLDFMILRVLDEYAIVARDNIEVHFRNGADSTTSEAVSAYLRVDDVDSMHVHLRRAAEGGSISRVETKPWGMREFTVRDPDGNVLHFGEPAAT